MLSRVNTLEEGKGGPRNDTEERIKIESALTSLHQRISELEKGNIRGGGSLPAWPAGWWDLARALASYSKILEFLGPSRASLPPAPHPAQGSGPRRGVAGGAGAPGLWLPLCRGSREGEGLPGVPVPPPRTGRLAGFFQV